MADDSQKSAALTGLDATPILRPNPWKHGGTVREAVAVFSVADNASIGSIYRFARVPSFARITSILLFCNTLTAGAADIGLYRSAKDGGAVVDVDFFSSAQSIATASALGIECAYEAADAATNMGIGEMENRIFEVLGLTTDPNIEYDLAATLTAAVTDPGFLCFKTKWVI